ncbi:MAG: cation-translocating P-type ATPase, partial [Chlamydiia bacterium]|nr:cation-translocating P-type ATPase [Chlamydiia bacterium]
REGVLIRNRRVLPFLGKESCYVFDKTGTLTEGKFQLLRGLEKLEEEERMLLWNLARHSLHPVSTAIVKAIEESGECRKIDLKGVEELSGKGLVGSWNGKRLALGSPAHCSEQGIELKMMGEEKKSSVNRVEGEIVSKTYFAIGRSVLAEILLGDRLRLDAVSATGMFVGSRWLLSGDAEPSVRAVANQCRFDDWRAGLAPLEKRAFVDRLKEDGEVVLMLGDGINDAPSLTAAHIGVCVVNATDLSAQICDILLTDHRLDRVALASKKGKKAHGIVRQNLVWSFSYNIVGIGLAVTGNLSPLYAAFAMVASSIFVLLNANRMRKGVC